MFDVVVNRTFDQMVERLRETCEPRVFDLWFKRFTLLRFQRGVWCFGVPNVIARDWILEHHRGLLESVAEEILGSRITIQVEVSEDLFKEQRLEIIEAEKALTLARDEALSRRLSFENFTTVEENRFAELSLRSASLDRTPGLRRIVGLFGPAGCGKTHLLRAYTDVRTQGATKNRVLNLDALGFASRYALAMKNRTTADFRASLTGYDAVTFDEVHRLKGKAASQREFLSLLDRWLADGTSVVIAGRHLPQDIHDVDEQLKSRLQGVHHLSLRAYGVVSLLEIAARSFPAALRLLPRDVLTRLTQGTHGNVAVFRERLVKAQAYAQMVGKPLTLRMVNDDMAAMDERKKTGIDFADRLIAATCHTSDIKRDEILSKRKLKSLIEPRGLLVCLLRDEAKLTFKEIGRRLGGRSHTSVFLLYRKYRSQITASPFAAKILEAARAPSVAMP